MNLIAELNLDKVDPYEWHAVASDNYRAQTKSFTGVVTYFENDPERFFLSLSFSKNTKLTKIEPGETLTRENARPLGAAVKHALLTNQKKKINRIIPFNDHLVDRNQKHRNKLQISPLHQ